MEKNSRGFSLIELLIVVAIILIIAAIAIPNLLRTKMTANQASAVSSLRTLNTANATYSSAYNIGYTLSLVYLGPGASATSTTAGLIDSVLAGGTSGAAVAPAGVDFSTKSGYIFGYTPGGATSPLLWYTVIAYPVVVGSSGNIPYYTDPSGVIRMGAAGGTTATSTDSPVGA